ncbi:hypothetical protein [Streptomyces rugosispiralis]|uniref:Uncharacterized protein n=1 Tax=Streptomyces rugosispiralis TaxID=2967341 RepID=A0ABT1VEE8_9ACTN|nr:hypothetical protein [Streptomyces rugosispiralis]MCQ8195666.1 hypothetical protein [Streptomyces rugosispiralis]
MRMPTPTSSGWGGAPLRIWEHETVDAAVGKVVEVLGSRGHPQALRMLGEAVATSR